MGIYSKYKNVNTVFGGTGGLVLPSGTTAERDSGTVVGTLRYNSDLGLVEQYNALGWQSVDAPPTVTSFSGVINENTNTTLTITGSNFKTGAVAYITGLATSSIDRAVATTWVSASTITVATNAASVNYVGGAAFGLKVTNPSGLSGTLDPAGNVDRDPIWQTASTTSSPTVIYDAGRSTSITYSATDADGNAISYSLVSGSLPAGATLNTSTGVVSGFSAVASDTTSSFTLRATSTSSSGGLVSTQDRGFAIQIKAPVVTSYTSVASTTWTAPFTGNIQVLVVAGGGAGGGGTAGGGGAGGLVYHSAYPVTNGTPYGVTVGGGGPMPTGQNTGQGNNGGNSVFGGITAVGGGGGAGYNATSVGTGGSGGGGGQYPGWPGSAVGAGGVTANTVAGGSGYGNPGGPYSGGPTGGSHGGGGGGGAGAAGQAGPLGAGGVGLAYSITGSSVTYAGGGMGASNVDTTKSNAAGGGGRGGPGGQQNGSPYPGSSRGGESGAANTGGGGGGGWDYGGGGAGQGGSGIVVLRY